MTEQTITLASYAGSRARYAFERTLEVRDIDTLTPMFDILTYGDAQGQDITSRQRWLCDDSADSPEFWVGGDITDILWDVECDYVGGQLPETIYFDGDINDGYACQPPKRIIVADGANLLLLTRRYAYDLVVAAQPSGRYGVVKPQVFVNNDAVFDRDVSFGSTSMSQAIANMCLPVTTERTRTRLTDSGTGVEVFDDRWADLEAFVRRQIERTTREVEQIRQKMIDDAQKLEDFIAANRESAPYLYVPSSDSAAVSNLSLQRQALAAMFERGEQ